MADSSSSRLLGLPGELRNRIYQFCLVEGVVDLNSKQFPEPSLLSTCKEVRAEAGSIFYNENKFIITIQDFDAAPIVTLHGQGSTIKSMNVHSLILDIRIRGQPSWDNLELWLNFEHASGCGLLPGQVPLSNLPDRIHVQAMHDVVDSLRDLPWERVQFVLRQMRKTLIAIDQRWAD